VLRAQGISKWWRGLKCTLQQNNRQCKQIKADRPLTSDTLNIPWLLTNRQFQCIRSYHWLNSASRVLISTCSTPLVQTGERKQFSLFDLDLWPMTFIYNPRLPRSTLMPKIKVKRFKQESAHRQTDGHTHGCYQMYYLPVTWSITIQW